MEDQHIIKYSNVGIKRIFLPCTVFFAPIALKPPNAPTMKYWNILFPVSLPCLYLPKEGMTVVSCSLPVPRWKGERNSACEVEASATLRCWTATTEERRAGCRGIWRRAVVAALARDMVEGRSVV